MIVHFDLDAFYASVAQRDDPSLRGIPLAISGRSRRAVVLTASYEARPFGVRSAMPLYRALELCPELTVVPPDFTRYRESSQRVFAIFVDGARAVEGLSLDEAFVDVPDETLDGAIAFAQRVRARIRDEVGLTASAGVARTKMVAKIASDMNKPDGLTVVPPGTEADFLAPLPVGRLWGIGPKTQPRLESAGISTIGDVAALDDARMYALFGRGGTFYRDLARGIDERDVDGSRERKSISTEETFEYDVRDEARILDLLRLQADELARDMQAKHLRGATVGIKIKRADFTITGKQTTLAVPTDDAGAILAASLWCWHRSGLAGVPIRLLGTRIASLTEEPQRELRLF
ncbi:DNA polymerase IV [Vulcanimicrobium alpinum]|uniref:DNA polymerase IV n=1 Tax=Vulcanimicrobium alpinum TaxID=3016050 RepID=A0AAN1XW40_UNVUL|nr:DNA polymerase IV [Vulcanimicrobium alpinum]BDE05362.1 DNA polymerase IV [Vulcanimicrobium alpinum]